MCLLAYMILTPGVLLSVEDSIGIGWVCQTYEQIKQAKTLINISPYQERSQKGDSGCASEKLGVPHLLSD